MLHPEFIDNVKSQVGILMKGWEFLVPYQGLWYSHSICLFQFVVHNLCTAIMKMKATLCNLTCSWSIQEKIKFILSHNKKGWNTGNKQGVGAVVQRSDLQQGADPKQHLEVIREEYLSGDQVMWSQCNAGIHWNLLACKSGLSKNNPK